MNGALQFNVEPTLDFLRTKRSQIDAAIAAIEVLGSPAPEPSATGDAPPARGGAHQKPASAPKSKPAKAKASKRAAKVDDAEPIARKGRAPVTGVQQLYCADEKERREKVAALKADGYERAGMGVRLGAGMFDVRPSGDEDGTSVVLWREKEAAGD